MCHLSFPTLALPRSGVVEAYTSSQTVHRLPYIAIITKRPFKVKYYFLVNKVYQWSSHCLLTQIYL